MKIYTKTGDEGKTSLIGGKEKVLKNDLRIEAYGTVDELNAWIGLISVDPQMDAGTKKLLKETQDRLFTIGSLLAVGAEDVKMALPSLIPHDILVLEEYIDDMESDLPDLKHFILPGGNTLVSQCHLARTVCRRAERNIVALSATQTVGALIIPYLNRLSDFLFVLSRKISADTHTPENIWVPRTNAG